MSIVVHGKELPGTERVLDGRLPRRGSTAWWEPDDYQAGPRRHGTSMLVGHWTAGEAGLHTSEDDGYFVVAGMRHRMSKVRPNKKLRVSVGFVIGACTPDDEMAPIWQTMDPGTTTGVHVGSSFINRRSIGVEIVNAGVPGKLNTRHRKSEVRHINGQDRRVLPYYLGQLNAWVWLAEVLTLGSQNTPSNPITKMLSDANIVIPRQVPFQDGRLLTDRLTRRGEERWRGVLEHHHVHNTRKIDAGNYLVEACLTDGFVGKEV